MLIAIKENKEYKILESELEKFTDLGYEIFKLERGKLKPLSQLQKEAEEPVEDIKQGK